MKRCEISVVVPVYGCAGCLATLYERLCRTLDDVADWEVVFVDDSSPDGAWEHLEELASRDQRVRALRLSRNFGQHAAITAGLAEAHGDWVTVMDCDLQDPPEEIPRLLVIAKDGHDVVLTQRDQRRQAWHRRVGARLYFRARNVLLGQSMNTEYSTLSVISRSVVDAFLSLGDRDRQYMLILHWLGFRRTVISLAHEERHEGRSAYTLAKLVEVALDGMFFQTTRLLRWIVYVGFAIALAGVVLAAVFVGLYFTSSALPGFTSLAVLLLLVGGFIIVSTGIAGLYVGKIFEQVKGRPLYVIERRAPGDQASVDRSLELAAPATPARTR
ncbi:MAG TPA: glycosyltransferase family 2 protein [Solirubrobacteraceae bacterium]|jgi:dolichol-phosphate mannosyltransferase|nr:glycosyltransferase family 2 protein [Solirubrobacteraceae bacterium]